MAICWIVSQEGMVSQWQHTGKTEKVITKSSADKALETGPLTSEDQGLDLSVDIVLAQLCNPSFVCSASLLGQYAILLRKALLVKEWDVRAIALLDMGFCDVISVDMEMRGTRLLRVVNPAVLQNG